MKKWRNWCFVTLVILIIAIVTITGCSQQETGTVEQNKDNQHETETVEQNKDNQAEDWPETISIGAATPGGGMFVAASAVANVLQREFPEIVTTVEVTGAAVENSQLLQAGEVEMGMITTEIAWEAYNAEGVFADKPEHKRLRTLFPGYSNVFVLVTDKDNGINSIEELDKKIIATGSTGSANQQFGDRVAKAAGIEPNVQGLRTTDAVEALKNKQIAAYVVGLPNSTTVEHERATGKTQILVLEGEAFTRFEELYPQYLKLQLPLNYLDCITEAKPAFGCFINVHVAEDLPEDFVYEVVKALYENRQTIIKDTNPAMAENMDLENISMATVPYHPGSIKYFLEQGYKVPDHLLPPEYK